MKFSLKLSFLLVTLFLGACSKEVKNEYLMTLSEYEGNKIISMMEDFEVLDASVQYRDTYKVIYNLPAKIAVETEKSDLEVRRDIYTDVAIYQVIDDAGLMKSTIKGSFNIGSYLGRDVKEVKSIVFSLGKNVKYVLGKDEKLRINKLIKEAKHYDNAVYKFTTIKLDSANGLSTPLSLSFAVAP